MYHIPFKGRLIVPPPPSSRIRSQRGDADNSDGDDLPSTSTSQEISDEYIPTRLEEIVAEGKALFTFFLHQQFQKQGYRVKITQTHTVPIIQADSNESIDSNGSDTSNIINNLSSQYQSAIMSLQKLTEEYAKSKERQIIRQQANEMESQLLTLTEDSYYQRLLQLISEGITVERILGVFHFAYDVAIIMLKAKFGPIVPILQWTQTFLAREICTWVEEHGGWDVVLGTGMEFIERHNYIVAGGVSVALMVLAIIIRTVWLFL